MIFLNNRKKEKTSQNFDVKQESFNFKSNRRTTRNFPLKVLTKSLEDLNGMRVIHFVQNLSDRTTRFHIAQSNGRQMRLVIFQCPVERVISVFQL